MTLHKHEPIAEYKMYWYSAANTICSVLREIYFSTEDPGIKRNCRVATTMAKAMSAKLSSYKQDWEKEFWEKKEQ